MTVNRRSELERLVDLTVLGPTHPQLGTCWQFTGTRTPYGRIAKAQDSYAHRLGWKLLSQTARSCITDAASMPAGTRTTWSRSRTPRTSRTCARRTASTVICCQATTCGSARTACGLAGHATPRPSGRSASGSNAPAEPLTTIPHSIGYVNFPLLPRSSLGGLSPVERRDVWGAGGQPQPDHVAAKGDLAGDVGDGVIGGQLSYRASCGFGE